jgi:hypothetical protein
MAMLCSSAPTPVLLSLLFIAPASKYVKGCHSGLDPESSTALDSSFREKDRVDIYGCRSNNTTVAGGQSGILDIYGIIP